MAYATIISQAGAFFTAVIYLNKTHEIINLSFRKLDFDKLLFRKSIKIGFPVGFQQAFVALSFLAMFWIVNPFGTNASAAYSVAFRIDSFAAMPSMNFAIALASFVGQNLGANKLNRVKKGFYTTLKITALISITMSAITVLFREPIFNMFTSDSEVISIGANYLVIVAGFYITFSTMLIIGGVMRGAGATLIPMFITLLVLWLVRIPLSYFLSQKIGISGIWWGIPMAWVLGMTLQYIYYLSGRWKTKVVVKR